MTLGRPKESSGRDLCCAVSLTTAVCEDDNELFPHWNPFFLRMSASREDATPFSVKKETLLLRVD